MNVKEHIEELIKHSKDVDEIHKLAKAYQMIVHAETQDKMTDFTVNIGHPPDFEDDIVN